MTNCNTSASTLIELRISKAYVRLCSLPEGGPQASVSVALIGSFEIRMLADPAADRDSTRLFWLELLDHSTKTSVDSFCCYQIKDAVPVVRDFFEQVDGSNKPGDNC